MIEDHHRIFDFFFLVDVRTGQDTGHVEPQALVGDVPAFVAVAAVKAFELTQFPIGDPQPFPVPLGGQERWFGSDLQQSGRGFGLQGGQAGGDDQAQERGKRHDRRRRRRTANRLEPAARRGGRHGERVAVDCNLSAYGGNTIRRFGVG